MMEVLREKHEVSESVALRLACAGGRNRFGEPNYRASWGWNRLAWIGGKFEERDPQTGSLVREVVELRQEPKYPAVNRWHIERWVPPEAYGPPRAWYAQTVEIAGGRSVPALGPYPSRGEYEHCLTLHGKGGEFLQLTATAAEYIARAIEWSRRQPRRMRRDVLQKRLEQDDREYEEFAYGVLDASAPAFHGLPFVSIPRSL